MSQDVKDAKTLQRSQPEKGRAANTRILSDDVHFGQQPAETLGRDLLKNRFVSALMRSRWYPGAFQIPIAAVFGLVAYQLLAGPTKAHETQARP